MRGRHLSLGHLVQGKFWIKNDTLSIFELKSGEHVPPVPRPLASLPLTECHLPTNFFLMVISKGADHSLCIVVGF